MSRIPDYLIERVHLGEATSEQRARVLADPHARARLEALEAENAAFLDAHPAREHVGAIQRKVHLAKTRDAVERRRRGFNLMGAILVPAAALVAVVAIAPDLAGPPEVDIDVVDMGTRIKGPPRLLVYRRTEGVGRLFPKRTVLREHDSLRLAYRKGRAEHGVLVSLDGRGVVTVHSPDEGHTTALREGANGLYMLPHGYALDDAPDFERFFFVTSDDADTPIDPKAVVGAVEALAAQGNGLDGELSLPSNLEVQDFTILKDVL